MIKFTISGDAITKKNSMQIVTLRGVAGNRPIIVPSQQYKRYKKDFLWQVPNDVKHMIDEPVNLKCLYFMKTKRKVDLCNLIEATQDLLVDANVLADDNSSIVMSIDGSRVLYDKDNPRVEIEITDYEGEYDQWKK